MINPQNSAEQNIQLLEQKLDEMSRDNRTHAYWAFIFLKLARLLVNKSQEGEFAKPQLVMRLVALNIEAYLDMLDRLETKQEIPHAWKVAAVGAHRRTSLSFFQQLTLDTSAEVSYSLLRNLSLGFSKEELESLEDDFEKIGKYVAGFVDKIGDWCGEVWGKPMEDRMNSCPFLPFPAGFLPLRQGTPPFFEHIESLLLNYQRKTSLKKAEKIREMQADEQEKELRSIDEKTSRISRQILNPPLPFMPGVAFLKSLEPESVKEVLELYPAD